MSYICIHTSLLTFYTHIPTQTVLLPPADVVSSAYEACHIYVWGQHMNICVWNRCHFHSMSYICIHTSFSQYVIYMYTYMLHMLYIWHASYAIYMTSYIFHTHIYDMLHMCVVSIWSMSSIYIHIHASHTCLIYMPHIHASYTYTSISSAYEACHIYVCEIDAIFTVCHIYVYIHLWTPSVRTSLHTRCSYQSLTSCLREVTPSSVSMYVSMSVSVSVSVSV